jgi:ribonuclease R
MPRKPPQKYKGPATAATEKTFKRRELHARDSKAHEPPSSAARDRNTNTSSSSAAPHDPALLHKASSDPFSERESQKYIKPIPSREAILAYLSHASQLLTIEALASGLELAGAENLSALDKRINAMLRDGQLLLNRRGGLAVAEKADLISGTVIANADGFGFLRRDDAGGEDVFLSPSQMKQVLHGDRALISITGQDRRGKPEGMIANVLERRSPKVVGRFLEEKLFGVVAPDDRRIHQDIQIPHGASMHAKPGDVVVAEITEPPTSHRPPIGRVVRIFGSDIGPQHAVDLAIESFDLPTEFPADVLAEAARVAIDVTPAQMVGRVDLRRLPLVTIDGEDARDFDDAVWCEPNKTGGYKLIVAIADVAAYVAVGGAIDAEAQRRSTSVYFPSRVLPMLPENLSNGMCSLKPEVDRLCLACELSIDAEGNIKRSKFYKAVMRSAQRLSYNLVWQALGEQSPEACKRVENVLPQLQYLYALYKALDGARRRRGAIEFEGQEVKFAFDEAGEIKMVTQATRNDAHKLIEECMIAANVAAAKFLSKAKVPALYRVHASPPMLRYEDAREFLASMGVRLPAHEQLSPGDITKVLRAARARPDGSLIEAILLRTQSLAVYKASNDGHFGLALDAYAHFTSPIRRYPDLLVHRAIYHALDSKETDQYHYTPAKMEDFGKQCSSLERRADEASRDVNERLKCAFLEKHIGEDFNGIVTGVTSFGAFVEIDDMRISGMVHVTQLPNDYYHFDPQKHRLSGERTGMGISLSDKVRIKVLRVDTTERKIDFKLISPMKPQPKGTQSASKSPRKFDAQPRQHAPQAKPKARRR